MFKKKEKKIFAWIVVLAMFYSIFPADTPVSHAAAARTSVESEFDTSSDRFGSTVNSQMNSYLTGGISGGDRAEVETDLTFAGFKSKITFHMGGTYDFLLKKDDNDADNQVLRWVNQAISNYPNLCTLFTNFSYTATVDAGNNHYLRDITVYSPVSAGEIIEITNSYKKALSDLVAVPLQDKTMTKQEKALYVHDKLILSAEYSQTNDNLNHTPMSVLVRKEGVCQSYCYAYNHAMNELGIDSLFLMSTTHSWNALRLNGKWYYVDVTWDDPVGQSPSFVGHDYFLVPPAAFASDHTLTPDYNTVYGSILNKMGNKEDLSLPEPTPEPSAPASDEPSAAPQPTVTVETPAPIPTATAEPSSPDTQVTPSPTVTALGKTSILSLKNKAKGKVLITYKKVKGAAGYQISYSLKSNFKNDKKMNAKKKTASLSKLKRKKTYYFRVRSYIFTGNKKQYSKWSSKKKIKIRN